LTSGFSSESLALKHKGVGCGQERVFVRTEAVEG
jgi:hypothetical protein